MAPSVACLSLSERRQKPRHGTHSSKIIKTVESVSDPEGISPIFHLFSPLSAITKLAASTHHRAPSTSINASTSTNASTPTPTHSPTKRPWARPSLRLSTAGLRHRTSASRGRQASSIRVSVAPGLAPTSRETHLCAPVRQPQCPRDAQVAAAPRSVRDTRG